MPASDPAAATYTRLYISPLDADLLPVVLPPAALSAARGVSFHRVETFERRFGYVELPEMEAEKLRRKLNGSVLRGSKVKVEKARPEAPLPEPESEAPVPPAEEERTKKRKRGRERDILEGVELRDRKVKRGWTESPDTKRAERKKKRKSNDGETEDKKKEKKKEKKTSKYTDKDECLFKAKLPTTVSADTQDDEGQRKKKKKGKASTTVIHEFEHNSKFPTFLKETRSSKADAPAEFVEGKGWIDGEGNTVEPVRTTRATRSKSRRAEEAEEPVAADIPDATAEESEDTSSDSETSSSEEESESDAADEEAGRAPAEASSAAKKKRVPAPLASPASSKLDSSRPKSSSSSKSLTIKIPPVTPATDKVHPLEALYKKLKPAGDGQDAAAAVSEPKPFSFFDAEDGAGGGTATQKIMVPPMTPYTREDMEWRNMRSAAPTPDTAHPSRRIFWADDGGDSGDDDDEEEKATGGSGDGDAKDEAEEDTAMADLGAPGAEEEGGDGKKETEQSDFQKYFWENRADLNRSWVKRKKTAGKDKRRRENKARSTR